MINRKEDATPANLQRELDSIRERLKYGQLADYRHFPRYLQIETTRLCNARCPFCASRDWNKDTPFMSDRLFDKVAEELGDHAGRLDFIALQRAGEPLLDKKIYARIRRMKEEGVGKVVICTNASCLTENNAHKLVDAGLDELLISIDSVIPEQYAISRAGLRYDQVVRNIRAFFKVRDARKPELGVRVRGVSYHNLGVEQERRELEAWEAFWEPLRTPCDRIYMKKAHNWGNQKVWDGHTPEYEDLYHPCIVPWGTMHVTAMGKVPLCPLDYDAQANLGDINTQSIAEVWRGAGWERVRAIHAAGRRNELPFCRGCRLFDPEGSLEGWREKEARGDAPEGEIQEEAVAGSLAT